MRDFTLPMYAALLESLRAQGRVSRRFDELESRTCTRSVVLRHDVDRLPGRALALGRLEAQQGMRSTYFFRTRRVSFRPGVIRELLRLGHEIGYHYECLSDTRGDVDSAWRLFQAELRKFDRFGGVRTIAMHGRPFSRHDNRDLWEKYDYREAGVQVEAYLSLDADRYAYFTDTGRRWDSELNRRDFLGRGGASRETVRTTLELIGLTQEMERVPVISTHPERWAASTPGWLQVLATDQLTNALKMTLRRAGRGSRT